VSDLQAKSDHANVANSPTHHRRILPGLINFRGQSGVGVEGFLAEIKACQKVRLAELPMNQGAGGPGLRDKSSDQA
jgi:hypothetical protein